MSETKNKRRVYKGENLNVSYDIKLCMHAAECVKSGLKNVFDTEKRPWINPDGSSPERVIDVVERCPSGALAYDYGVIQEVAETNSVRPQPNSALYLRGNIRLENHDESVITEQKRLALCRCGQSSNKPFCDYSHHEITFEDNGDLGEAQLGDGPINTEAKLTVTTLENGPLRLAGAFVLRSADNSDLRYGDNASLCRCGASSNKPFCDGTHTKIGFKA